MYHAHYAVLTLPIRMLIHSRICEYLPLSPAEPRGWLVNLSGPRFLRTQGGDSIPGPLHFYRQSYLHGRALAPVYTVVVQYRC